jgi:ribonuclease G
LKIDFIINAHPEITRIAVVEDGKLMELIAEQSSEKRLVGNIYLGSVNAVLPGMQAAFVDIGLERSAFLHVSDVRTGVIQSRRFAQMLVDGKPPTTRDVSGSIEDVLRKGQDILVQLTKEPIGTKGARVSTRISIAGRYVVSMPGDPVSGVSRKISDRSERARLRNILSDIRTEGFGIIARTAGISHSEDNFRRDVERIVQRWKEIGELALKSKAPALLHEEHDIVTITLRDIVSTDASSIVTDSKEVATRARKYLRSIAPPLANKVRLYRGKKPIFDNFGIEEEIGSIMTREVRLKSGGSIFIDHTEALVSIDVNTKRYVGRKSQSSTILKTNMEAATEIARQLRLRDLGGIIVIDFIDMDIEDHRNKVLNCLRSELGRDRSPTKTCQLSPLGLVEMTRKRVRPSIMQSFSEPCPLCGGSGRVLSAISAATRLERFLERASLGKKHRNLVVSVHPDLADYLLDEEGHWLEYLDHADSLKLEIYQDPRLKVDEFRVYSLDTHEEVTEFFSPATER